MSRWFRQQQIRQRIAFALAVVMASLAPVRGELGAISNSNPSYAYSWTYDAANNVVSEAGYNHRLKSDGNWQLVPDTQVTRTFGPHGNVLTEYVNGYSGSSTSTTTYYDASKYFQKASVTDASGNVSSFDYFANNDASAGNRGEVKWVRDARYGVTGEQFEYTYNSYGQKLTEINLNNVETDYTYGDAWGNLTQVVQDPGMGHLNRTTQMVYDPAGRVTSSTDPKSQSSSFTYNAVGQPTQATLPGETVSYTYGANGRTATVTDGRGTTTIAYETGNDRVASVTDPVTGAMSYTYNADGSRATLVLPGGNTWTYAYRTDWYTLPKADANSHTRMLQKVTDDQGKEVEYWFDTRGRMYEAKQKINGGTVTNLTTYTYQTNGSNQGRGFLTEIKNEITKPGFMGFPQTTLIVKNAYSYDNNGNRTANAVYDATGLIRTESYGYDALNRLTSVNYGDGQTQSYTFDAMGNRSQKVDSIGGTENYTYNNANMLLTRGANNYTNDSNGNTLTGGGRTNTWDGQNRLTQCVYSGTATTFTYGADGLRRSSASGGTTTNSVLDGDNELRELQSGSPVATYLHGPRGPESRRDGSNVYRWYVYDGLGSVLAEVDVNGTVTATRKYDVYGAVRATTGTGTSNHKFVGSLGHPSEDGTGLVNMRARNLDPITGCFTNEDGARHKANWFTYASGNPVNRVDRSGKSDADIQSLGVLFGLIGIALLGTGVGSFSAGCTGLQFAQFDTLMRVALTGSSGDFIGLLKVTWVLANGFAQAALAVSSITAGLHMAIAGAMLASLGTIMASLGEDSVEFIGGTLDAVGARLRSATGL